MTVRWSRYAQSLTKRPVKGMLTGPGDDPAVVVRSRRSTARRNRQTARAGHPRRGDRPRGGGIRVIQIDEPALREACRCGAPTGRTTCGGRSTPSGSPPPACATPRKFTRICATASSTTCCASSSAWTPTSSRSRMPGPDRSCCRASNSTSIPTRSGGRVRHPLAARARHERDHRCAAEHDAGTGRRADLGEPDCGLKTRGWDETLAALKNMVAAAREMRMAATDIGITAEPIDNQRCKFIVSQPVLAGGVRRFSDPAEAKGSPLARRSSRFRASAVGELIVSGNIVTVVKQSPAPGKPSARRSGTPYGPCLRRTCRRSQRRQDQLPMIRQRSATTRL